VSYFSSAAVWQNNGIKSYFTTGLTLLYSRLLTKVDIFVLWRTKVPILGTSFSNFLRWKGWTKICKRRLDQLNRTIKIFSWHIFTKLFEFTINKQTLVGPLEKSLFAWIWIAKKTEQQLGFHNLGAFSTASI